MEILITGVAGFIGMHLAQTLLIHGNTIIGIDSLNDYYDVDLKKDRLMQLKSFSNFFFYKENLNNRIEIDSIMRKHHIKSVVHLAAQAGVRYSIEHPENYIDNNISATLNLFECCRHFSLNHIIYASSSSIYGNQNAVPFKEENQTDWPVSVYAMTKKSVELMANVYHTIYKLPLIGLRLFTVYGPWGRPDMSPFLFVDSILKNKPIKVFNQGEMLRDFTYIADVCDVIKKILQLSLANNTYPQIYNLGNGTPIHLKIFIETIENLVGQKANKIDLPMQKGDVYQTYADSTRLNTLIERSPATPLREGLSHFINWYQNYHKI